MTKFFKVAAGAVLPALAMCGVIPHTQAATAQKSEILTRYADSGNPWQQMLRGKELRAAKGIKVPAEAKAFVAALKGIAPANAGVQGNIPAAMTHCDAAGWLTLPGDAGYWYYGINYTKEVIKPGEGGSVDDTSISGFKLTVYNEKFETVTTINGSTPREEGETRIVAVEVSDFLTQKYFKTDANYEIFIHIAANTPKYINNYRTAVYSIDPKATEDAETSPLVTLPGTVVNATDATDRTMSFASEKYYMTLLDDGYLDSSGNFTQASSTTDTQGKTPVLKFSVVKGAGWGDFDIASQTLKDFYVPTALASYTDGVNFIATYDTPSKNFYFGPVSYSKPFLNPAWEEDETGNEPFLSADNTFDTKVWKQGSYGTPSEEASISIRCEQPEENLTQLKFNIYSIGLLEYNDDLKIGLWSPAGEPSVTVAVDAADFSTEHFPRSYYVFGPNGDKIRTIAENTTAAWALSPIKGEPEQYVFGLGDDTQQSFKFINIDADLSSPLTLNATDYNGNTLTSNLDRVPVESGYNYVVGLGAYETNDKGASCKAIDWIDQEGNVVHHDLIDAGDNNMGVLPNLVQDALLPYTYTTADVRAYACMVKRPQSDGTIATNVAVIDNLGNILFEKGAGPDYGPINSAFIFNGIAEPAMWVVYADSKSKYTVEVFPLPLQSFAKGDGTEASPYEIATAGDLAQVRQHPGAYFKVVNDIDCGSIQLQNYGSTFTGSIDGAGHSLTNLHITGNKTSLLGTLDGATVKNLVIVDPVIDLSSNSASGLIATTAGNSTLSNIHVYRLKAESTTNSKAFGGLASTFSQNSVIEACSVNDAAISLTSEDSESVGGLVGKLTTSAQIKASSFSGTLTGGTEVGGIAGSSVAPRSSEEGVTPLPNTIANCRVDATVSAMNTVGGIIGSTERITITNSYVQGSVAATENSRWEGPVIGGLIGSLQPVISGDDVKTITGNVVNISKLEYTPAEGAGMGWDNRNKTAHRLIGASAFSANPEEYDGAPHENSLDKNYVNSAIPVIDSAIGAGASTIEGADIASGSINKSFLEGLGWVYGTSVDAPWNETKTELPFLYYQDRTLAIIPSVSSADIKVGEELTVTFEVIGGNAANAQVSYEIGEAFDLQSYSTEDNMVIVTIVGVKKGTSPLTVSADGVETTVSITVDNDASIDSVNNSGSHLSYDGVTVKGDGIITLYNLNGIAVASGNQAVNTETLGAGVYVATCGDSVLKIIVR